MYRVRTFLKNYFWALAAGTAVAMLWANLAPDSYATAIAVPLWFGDPVGQDASEWLALHGTEFGILELGDVRRVLTPVALVNQVFMALFLALAAKELWEAVVLDHGALRGRRAVLPMAAGSFAALMPALIYLSADTALGLDAAPGWAIPTATDIAVTYAVGRAVFGAGHPALRLLLVIAVADDGLGFLFLAVTSALADPALAPGWLILPVAAAVGVHLFSRQRPHSGPTATRRPALWPFAAAAISGWVGVVQAGLHPALGLLPIVPALPHTDRAFGVFAAAERYLHDPLNRIEHALRWPVGATLFLFALFNAGFPLSAAGPLTLVVAAALLLGKPLGMVLGSAFARILGAGDPALPTRVTAALGLAAATGFTMSLLLADAAPLAEGVRQEAGLGVILSALLAFPLARALARPGA